MRYIVVGGGIVGAAVAYRLVRTRPRDRVTLVEKEPRLAAHQTGRNSGVIHAGVYYAPGSLKARLCQAGNRSMVDFCQKYDLPVQVCGKLIVATTDSERAALYSLRDRAISGGLPVRIIEEAEARDREPHLRCRAALDVPNTGITDFAAVTRTLVRLAERAGAEVRLGARVGAIGQRHTGFVVQTTTGDIAGDVLINCAGLHSDQVARLAGLRRPPARIVPFRGEYFALREECRHLVRALIYPVPDPKLPFLGVHLTRGIAGGVHAGPNAVLAFAREGYSWSRVSPTDLAALAAYPGLWRLARRQLRNGATEILRSLSRRRFAADLARLVPQLGPADLVPTASGVRAQAIRPDGALIDDFLLVRRPGQIHLLNAPSPAATSALEIAKYVVEQLPED